MSCVWVCVFSDITMKTCDLTLLGNMQWACAYCCQLCNSVDYFWVCGCGYCLLGMATHWNSLGQCNFTCNDHVHCRLIPICSFTSPCFIP